jgi:hypothetical protein
MLSFDLSNKVTEFVESVITMSDLEEWLVPRLPMFLTDPHSDNSDVVAAIELGLAEVSNGIKTVDEFRHELRQVLRERIVQLAWHVADWPCNPEVQTGSSNRTENLVLSMFNEVAISVIPL